MVNTRFWIDDYVSHLDPKEKLMFLYFLTNPFTDICGIYEVPMKSISIDTGIEEGPALKILKRFERDRKIFYRGGWIGIANFVKYQLDNPKVMRGIELGLSKAPPELKRIMRHSLSLTMDRLSHSNPNSNLNSNPNSNSKMFPTKNPKGLKGKVSQSDNLAAYEIIKAFEKVNKHWYLLEEKRWEYDAALRLVQGHGKAQVLKVIAVLPETNKLPHVSNITTPAKLEEKWQDLENQLVKRAAKKSERQGSKEREQIL